MLYLCVSRMERAAPTRAFSFLFGASEGIFFLISGSTKCRVIFSKCRIDFFRKHLRKIIRHLVKTTKPADCKQRLFMLKVNRRRVPFSGLARHVPRYLFAENLDLNQENQGKLLSPFARQPLLPTFAKVRRASFLFRRLEKPCKRTFRRAVGGANRRRSLLSQRKPNQKTFIIP